MDIETKNFLRELAVLGERTSAALMKITIKVHELEQKIKSFEDKINLIETQLITQPSPLTIWSMRTKNE